MAGARDVGADRPGPHPADDPADTVRRAGTPHPPAAFRAALAADPAQLSPAREALRAWLTGAGVDEADVEVVLIAVGEACANAIEHGYRFAPGASVTVSARLRAERLEVEIRDTGGWREGPSQGGDRGRGRLIMARLMDEAQLDGTPAGTTVRLVKHLPGRG
ncbi:ATP-binding protein [Micromonospora sp. HUAS LYJ1]|uniref:ATP-binding protein n=1 Tax=Micromonospora sp. HUAS LYJ1 TaxID=3061626 RepID=UPI0026729D93|nr:ATP-binding protein [Micromonospora sp. HUAS LYJ1]WKU06623.1 ATP-binding protein [Micromonospora sp. HUAS LYJ1]